MNSLGLNPPAFHPPPLGPGAHLPHVTSLGGIDLTRLFAGRASPRPLHTTMDGMIDDPNIVLSTCPHRISP